MSTSAQNAAVPMPSESDIERSGSYKLLEHLGPHGSTDALTLVSGSGSGLELQYWGLLSGWAPLVRVRVRVSVRVRVRVRVRIVIRARVLFRSAGGVRGRSSRLPAQVGYIGQS